MISYCSLEDVKTPQNLYNKLNEGPEIKCFIHLSSKNYLDEYYIPIPVIRNVLFSDFFVYQYQLMGIFNIKQKFYVKGKFITNDLNNNFQLYYNNQHNNLNSIIIKSLVNNFIIIDVNDMNINIGNYGKIGKLIYYSNNIINNPFTLSLLNTYRLTRKFFVFSLINKYHPFIKILENIQQIPRIPELPNNSFILENTNINSIKKYIPKKINKLKHSNVNSDIECSISLTPLNEIDPAFVICLFKNNENIKSQCFDLRLLASYIIEKNKLFNPCTNEALTKYNIYRIITQISTWTIDDIDLFKSYFNNDFDKIKIFLINIFNGFNKYKDILPNPYAILFLSIINDFFYKKEGVEIIQKINNNLYKNKLLQDILIFKEENVNKYYIYFQFNDKTAFCISNNNIDYIEKLKQFKINEKKAIRIHIIYSFEFNILYNDIEKILTDKFINLENQELEDYLNDLKEDFGSVEEINAPKIHRDR